MLRRVLPELGFNCTIFYAFLALRTYLQEGSRRSGSSDAERRANVITRIVLLHAFDLESSLRGDVELTVSVVGEHELLRTLPRPEHRWLRAARSDALELRQTVDSGLDVLRLREEHWQGCEGKIDES